MTRQDEAPQRQRHRQPRKSLVPTRDGSKRVGAVDHGACYRRVPNPSASSLFLLVAAIVVSSMIDDGVARMKGTGFGVLAAPCVTENTTAWGGAEGERGGPIKVDVTATANLDLTSIFSCEGGDFEVVWSGAVNISGTIHIGLGTTVRIVGDSSPKDTTAGTSTSTASSGSNRSSSSIAGGSGNWSSSSQDEVDGLTVTLSIPRGLTSAVVGIGSSEISEATDKSIAFGPIFFVDGGQLSLENMAVRGGFVVNSTSTQTPSGAGIHAQSSNVTVTRCEFEDNFAELWGGGLYGNRSKLVVVDSVFRRCRAGFQVAPDEDVVDFAGGGIRVELSDVLVDGCLFENCYAGKKGGGMHQGIGRVSVLGSVFYNNTAGSGNVDDETEVGEGAALSFTSCTLSFDGKSSCGVNDTVFAKSHVGRKGGAVAIGSGDAPSHVEFHRCTVANSTTGRHTEDDPQGAGGAFAVGKGITLVLSDCVLSGNYCGNKGGVITLSSGENWGEKPGATLILRNSTFESNKADSDSGGVVYLDKFCSLTVAGDGNVFADNTCREDGAVFGATVNTNITVEGGVFRDNVAKQNGGVVWTKGHIEVLGGEFLGNEASDTGGVIISADDSTTILAGGVFEGNRAFDGGVVYVGEGSDLWVKGGQVSSNTAGNSGGAFAVSEGGHIQITGGNFTLNKADFGGFLLKEGAGTASCDGASIERNKGVNGGAIYAVEEAVVEWACDLKENEALAGPAIYARDKTTVELRGVSVLDNVVARGSAVFVVNSNLTTYQVHFKDTTKSSDLSAVQVDGGSTYMAEDTSFEGFAGEAVVFSEGELFLDDCDFSGSTAWQLVYAEPHSTVVIRNTVLGDNNYLPLAKASSLAGELPTADSLTNANTTCRDRGGQAGQDDTSSSPSSPSTSSSDVSPKNSSSPCSEGSVCLEGDLGVYCQCYLQRSTSKQRCVNGDAAALNLTTQNEPETMFFPEMLEGDLLLSHVAHSSSSAASDRFITVSNATGSSTSSVMSSRSETSASSIEPNSSSSSITNTSSSSGGDGEGSGDVTHGGGQFGVVWSVAAPKSSVSGTSMMDWTVFPSTGLLLPGESITLRVVTLPSTSFDGTASVTFKATGVGSDSTTTPIPSRTTLTKGANGYHVQDDSNLLDQETYYHYHGAATAQQAQQLTPGTSPSASQHSNESSLLKDVSGWGSNAKGSASFNVTFYHCATGQAWSPTASSILDCSEGDTCASCQLCSDVVEGEPEGVNCAEPGATLQTLPVKEGYWRAALDVAYIHGCSNEDACKGGSTVTSVQDYCHEGYMGPECTVCAPGYGRGAANHCHRCTTSFKAGMYFVITTAAVCALVVMALLAVYLVGGRGAVSSTVAGTKDSVRVLQRRTAVLLSRSDLGGRIDFTSPARAGGTRSSGVSGDGKEVPRRFRVRRSSVRGSRSTSSSGGGGGSEIDQDGDRRLEGGPGMRGPGGSLFPAKNNVRGLVVTPGWPGSRINQDGLATMVPERYSGSPSLPPLPAGGTWEAVLQGRIDRDNPESCCKPTRHHAYPSGTVRQLTSQQSVKRAYEGPPTTRAAGIERSTGNTEQPHLSVQRAEGGRETGVGVRGSGRNTEQAQSSEKHRAREADRDGTAAAKIGNKLAELPLSKIKIVIVVWQISSAFSNITNVAYPPIYEKFLSIIGVFTLDLAWILSASCLTTDVDFYDKLLMVTIGPLIFLGLLVVTFHIGARSRPVRPVATDAPISRNRRGGTQPAIGALQTTEPPTSGLALGKGRTSGTNPEDTSETVELPMSGPVLLRGRTSGMSGDTIALSPSERQTRRPGTSTVQHRSAAATYPHTLVLSRSERPARRAGASALQHRAAGGGELERESSGGQNTSANLDDATVNRSDSATMQTWSEGVVNSGANRPASPGPVERSSGRSQRSLMSVWKAGPGNVADPGQDHLWELFARHTTMTLILLYLIYSQVSTVVFQTFVCEKFPEISKSYLRADQRIECNTSTHMAYSTYAAVMIFLYPLGIPAAFYFLLWRQGSSINPPIHKYLKEQRGTQYVVQEKINQRSKDLGIAPTSFLWNAYYPNRYYFEVFECLRRLVLTGLLVFLVPDTPGQVAFSCVFAFVSLLAFELQRPHIDALEVQLYRTGCLVIFFTNFLALMIKAEVADENSAGSALYAVVLILVNIMFFLSIWWETWATMRATFSRRGFQGMVVGADVVGEDAVDRFMGPNRKRMRQKASHEGDGAEVNTQPAEDLPNLGRETRRHGSVCRQRHPHQVGEDAAPAGNRGHIGRSTELPFII